MRRAPIPHTVCGIAQPEGGPSGQSWLVRALAILVAILVIATVGLHPADAQNPSFFNNGLDAPTFKNNPNAMFGPPPTINKAAPLYMQADDLAYDSGNSRVVAQGNVEIYYNNFVLTADQVVYERGLNRLRAIGSVQLKDPNGNVSRAEELDITDNFGEAFVRQLSVVTKDDTRIAGERAIRREGNVTEFDKAKFTPCKSDGSTPPLWCISAARITHNQKTATISYQDAQFELFGQPVLYLPYFEHPDPTVKRRSGFLMPSFGNSTTLGFGVEVPYYFALAPNYDFTLHPRYWSKQGLLWQGDWRHKTSNGEYVVNLAGIDQQSNDLGGDGWRGSVETRGQFALSSWWRVGWDVTLESDKTFRRAYQLDSILQSDRVNVGYLQGMSERNYFAAKLYQFGSLNSDNGTTTSAYALPVIDYNYIAGKPVLGGELSFDAHVRSMTRTTGVNSNVLALDGNWRSKNIDRLGQVWTPFAALKGNVINYSDYNVPGLKADDSVFNGVVLGGATYSYPWVAHTGFGSHTIEPTAQIVARHSRVDQSKLPDEDARSLVFDDSLLFDTDKFSGYDRYETGTRANLGLQYTFQASNGVYAKGVFGQSIHLGGQNAFANPGLDASLLPNFSPYSGLGNTRSDYVAGAYLTPWRGFNLISQARFDERDWTLVRQDSIAQASYGPLAGVLGYTFSHFDPLTGDVIDQREINSTLTLRLTNTWSISGMVRYDIDAKDILQDQIQLKYSDECFVLSLNYIENHITNPAIDLVSDRTFMLRFELKNIGDFAYRTNLLNGAFGEPNNSPL
ncbi:MAG: LPS-assembly protein LptD [Hyphomicrobiaceae bacterium]|nr:LPS-assembly protein LptD [Hyphomicrobiaceae bacterium]